MNDLISAGVTRVVVALQDIVRILAYLQQTVKAGQTLTVVPPNYIVASLPATGQTGQLAYATNGRNSGQGVGAGTGCLCVWNGTSWIATWSGVTVTA